jgi:hypothetical protein
MAYGEAGQTASAKIDRNSIMDDQSRLNERLREVFHRVAKLGDTMHGSAPRDAGVVSIKGNAPEPVPTYRRYIDSASHTVHEIEQELTRIENLL